MDSIIELDRLYDLFSKHSTITTDSRNCPTNSIFFALRGEKFNGNLFAKETIKKGCTYAIVDEPGIADGKSIFYVEDTLKTLQLLARKHRETLRTPIIAVTGTNGKTTTKELTAAVLKQRFNLLYTQGNLNNHIGVPLTLLQLKKEHQMAIIEMGANHPGEIKTLVDIAKPDFGIITNVGKAHIAGFGSFEGVIHTKCELYDFLKDHNGVAFVNQANEILSREAVNRSLNTISYGQGTSNTAEIISSDPYLVIRWREHKIHTQLIGRYNFENVLAAITIGLNFNVDEDSIVSALESYAPTNNRSQFKKTERNELIIDAYNANPTSMKASLDNFLQIHHGNKAVILGDMKELGTESESEHQKIANKLDTSDIDDVFLVGENFAKTNCSKAKKFDNIALLNQYLEQSPLTDRLILIKGSNSMKLVDCLPFV